MMQVRLTCLEHDFLFLQIPSWTERVVRKS